MQISPEIKKLSKEQRLKQLERKYFEMELDKVSYEANGKTSQAEALFARMEEVRKAYEAVQNIDVEG